MDNHTLIVLIKLIYLSHFSSVFTKEDTSYVPELSNISSLPDMPPLHINTEGVTNLGINPYKSTGPDNIPAKFLKETAVQISPALSLIFQASINRLQKSITYYSQRCII